MFAQVSHTRRQKVVIQSADDMRMTRWETRIYVFLLLSSLCICCRSSFYNMQGWYLILVNKPVRLLAAKDSGLSALQKERGRACRTARQEVGGTKAGWMLKRGTSFLFVCDSCRNEHLARCVFPTGRHRWEWRGAVIINARKRFMKTLLLFCSVVTRSAEERQLPTDWLQGRSSVWQRDHVTRWGADWLRRLSITGVEKHLWTPLHGKTRKQKCLLAERLAAASRRETPRYVSVFCLTSLLVVKICMINTSGNGSITLFPF